MGRSGYTDDFGEEDQWALIRWRGAVRSAIKGKRGQAFLNEMLAALDALPEKRLISSTLRNEEGDVCAMGAVCNKRGLVPPTDLDEEDEDDYRFQVSKLLGIAPALVAEIAYINDDDCCHRYDEPEKRFARVRAWVVKRIRAVGPSACDTKCPKEGEP